MEYYEWQLLACGYDDFPLLTSILQTPDSLPSNCESQTCCCNVVVLRLLLFALQHSISQSFVIFYYCSIILYYMSCPIISYHMQLQQKQQYGIIQIWCHYICTYHIGTLKLAVRKSWIFLPMSHTWHYTYTALFYYCKIIYNNNNYIMT
jgi:hypothetical protein